MRQLYYRAFGHCEMILNDDGDVIVRVWMPGWLQIPDPATWPILRRFA